MADHNEQPRNAHAHPPRLALHGFDYDGRYVLGFPVHVALTVGVEHLGTCMKQLPLASWSGSAGAIGVRLVEPETGAEVLAFEPGPVVVPELGMSTFALAPGSCRRMLVDLSPYLPDDLKPGHYHLTVTYCAPSERVQSHVAAVDLAAPSSAEREELDQLGPELAREGSWGHWTNLPPRVCELVVPPKGFRDPLRFNRLLRYLMYGPQELRDVHPALIDALHGVYEPESHALLAELFWARGDVACFAENAMIVRTTCPGLGWWIDAIEAGRSEIAFVRAARRRLRGR